MYQHENGKYEFLPSATLRQILEGDTILSPILQVEETRFLELLRLAMYELSEPQVQKEAMIKEAAEIEKARELARAELERKKLAEEEKRHKEGW